jgi:DNA-binding transcriptional ArsR family regulator
MTSSRGPRNGLLRLPDEAIELIAARPRVIAEPMRIRLMGLLDQGDAGVQELAARLGTTPRNVSRHLGVLYQAGMVSRRRDGTRIRYSLVDWAGWWLLEQIGASVLSQLDELRGALSEQSSEPIPPADRTVARGR